MATTTITKQNHWVMIENDIAIVGIIMEAKEDLGDIAMVSLPPLGKKVKKGDETLIIESVKTATEISSPLDGEIIEVNKDISKAPKKLKELSMPYDWLFKIKIANPSQINDL